MIAELNFYYMERGKFPKRGFQIARESGQHFLKFVFISFGEPKH